MAVKEIRFDEATSWLQTFIEEKINLRIEDIDVNTIDIEKKTSKYTLVIHKPLPENLLDYLSKDVDYLLNRGYDNKVLEKHQVGYWKRLGTYMHERVIVPIRDIEERLIGFTGRSIWEKDEWMKRNNPGNNPKIKYTKWFHGRSYVKNDDNDVLHKTSVVLNIHNLKQYDEAILVEGPLDGMKLEMANILNWGGCLGSAVSPLQQYLLLKAGVKKLRLAFDPDKAGKSCTEKAIKLMSSNFEIDTVDIPEPYDIGALSVHTIRRLIQ